MRAFFYKLYRKRILLVANALRSLEDYSFKLKTFNEMITFLNIILLFNKIFFFAT